MNKIHKVNLAKKVYDGLVNYQVYNPFQIANACYLIGHFPQNSNDRLFMRNNLLNYFMNNLAVVIDHLEYTEPTQLELKQLQYIESKWSTEDLEKYIKTMDQEDDSTFDSHSINALDALFEAADEEKIEGVLPEEPEVEVKPLPNVEVKLEPYAEKKTRGRRSSK